MMDWSYGGGWMGMGGGVFMFAFWVVVIIGLALLVRWLLSSQGRSEGPHSDSALDILRKRYARGEIDRDEYEAKRRDLEG